MKFRAAIMAIWAAIALASAAPDPNAIIVKEKAIWAAAREKRLADFQQLVAPNVRAVYADGIMTMADELKAIPKRTMRSVNFAEFKVSSPDSTIAIVTYNATVQSESEGELKIATFHCGSVWRLNQGRWEAIFHGEAEFVPVPGPRSD